MYIHNLFETNSFKVGKNDDRKWFCLLKIDWKTVAMQTFGFKFYNFSVYEVVNFSDTAYKCMFLIFLNWDVLLLNSINIWSP